jgi:thiol-disulfide isomerase/thioredoxin
MKIIKIGAMWCPACILTNKFWNKIIDDNQDIEFVNYDIDLDEDEATKYGDLDVLPVVVIEKNGKEFRRIIGEHSKEEFEIAIKEIKNEKQ